MTALAPRFTPTATTVSQALAVAAEENIENRIIQALEKAQSEGMESEQVVRPLCMIAKIFLSGAVEKGETLEVRCPEDERFRLSSLLRNAETGNRIMLYPLSAPAYQDFAGRMKRVGRDMGEYTLFTLGSDGQWNVQEYT